MKIRTMQCPDFGEIKLQEFVTFNQVEKYYNISRNDPETAVNAFIMSIIVDSNISALSVNDKSEILKSVSSELEFLDSFIKCLSEETEYYIAFKKAFDSSEMMKSFENAYGGLSNLGSTIKGIYKVMQASSSTISSMQEIAKSISERYQPRPIDISKTVGSTFLSLNEQVANYQKLIKSNPFPLTTQFFNTKSIENNLLLNQSDVFKKLNQSISINLAYLQDISLTQKKLIEPISIFSKRYTDISNIFNLSDGLSRGLKENLEYINSGSKINWYNQFSHLSKIIINSDASIGAIHDYFSESQDIRSVLPRDIKLEVEDKQNFSEIVESISESESFIQDKTGSSLLLQRDIARSLFNKLDLIQTEQKKYSHVIGYFEQFLNPQKFSEFLDDFSILVSREYWEHFWENIGDKFKSAPESIAKSNLAMFLSGRYGRVGFIGQELKTGKGYIDVLVNLFGINNLVELKVIGTTTPISWAKSGISQLSEYMLRYNLRECYLIVFDGRKTERGEQLNDYYDVENGRVSVKTIKIYYPNKKNNK